MELAVRNSVEQKGLPKYSFQHRKVELEDGSFIFFTAEEPSKERCDDNNFIFVQTVTIDGQSVFIYRQNGEPDKRRQLGNPR